MLYYIGISIQKNDARSAFSRAARWGRLSWSVARGPALVLLPKTSASLASDSERCGQIRKAPMVTTLDGFAWNVMSALPL